MGMLGQWISKPRRFSDHDEALNTMVDLSKIRDEIVDGKLWLDLRKLGLVKGPLQPLDDHIAENWYNKDDKGWWPADPTEEIRTEALHQTINRIQASIDAGERKKVSSYWLCPGLDHFQIAICESDQEILVLVLTPSEGNEAQKGSPNFPNGKGEHRDQYIAYVDNLLRNSDNAVGVDGVRFEVNGDGLTELEFDALAENYRKGRRVQVKDTAGSAIFRVIASSERSSNSIFVTVNQGRGGAIPIGELTTHPVPLPDPTKLHSDPVGRHKVQDIWVVTEDVRRSEIDSDLVDAVVLGVAVRRHKDYY